jgi:hypothetical protein
VQNTRSRLEKRLAKLLAATPSLAARHTAGDTKVDLVYLDEETQDRLNSSLRE